MGTLAALGASALGLGCSPHETYKPIDLPEEMIAQIQSTVDDYRTALQACLKSADRDHLATLHTKAGSAHQFYGIARPDLKPEQRQQFAPDIRELDTLTIGLMKYITPQTRRIQHWLLNMERRQITFSLCEAGKEDRANLVNLMALVDSSDDDQLKGSMSEEEWQKYLDEPVK